MQLNAEVRFVCGMDELGKQAVEDITDGLLSDSEAQGVANHCMCVWQQPLGGVPQI